MQVAVPGEPPSHISSKIDFDRKYYTTPALFKSIEIPPKQDISTPSDLNGQFQWCLIMMHIWRQPPTYVVDGNQAHLVAQRQLSVG